MSVKEDIFAQLLVNVSDESSDLYDGLGHFLDDTVEFEGRQAEMEIDILDLPPILQIQLQVRIPLSYSVLLLVLWLTFPLLISEYNSTVTLSNPRRTTLTSSLKRR